MAELVKQAQVSRATFYRVFRSRAELLGELDLEPDPASRERILATALDMVGRHGLTQVSMDGVAERAQVSRATLYRLFPGKAALFREVIKAYSPLEAIGAILEQAGDRPPEEVMPELALTAYRTMRDRIGIIRTIFMEVTSADSDTEEAIRYAFGRAIAPLAAYLAKQMARGRLQPMLPLLALQAFLGPVFIHLATREIAMHALHVQIDPETAIQELARAWLRAMRPGASDTREVG